MTVNGVKLRKNGPFARAMGRSMDLLAQSLLEGSTAPTEPYPPFPEPTFEPNDPSDG